MPLERIDFRMRNGERAYFLKDGAGPAYCLLAGPGSFYLPMFSEELKRRITFLTFDDYFVYEKGSQIDQDRIDRFTIDELVERYGEAIEAIKREFHIEKIGVAGSSAATILTFQIALEREDIAFVMGIGVPFITLDTNFDTTNDLFMSETTSRRRSAFEEDQWNYAKIQEKDETASILPDSHLEEGRLTPNSDFVEGARAMRTKMLYWYEEETPAILNYWGSNPIGLINNPAMRTHFFTKLLPELNSQLMVDQILLKELPLFLVYGEQDYITPCDRVMLQRLNNNLNCKVFTYSECAHFPMIEKRDSFNRDVINFLSERLLLPVESSRREDYSEGELLSCHGQFRPIEREGNRDGDQLNEELDSPRLFS